MSKSLNDCIKELPPYIGKEIFKFIIPDSKYTEYYKKYSVYYENYSIKYYVAFFNDKQIKNNNGHYLSRILKKNGKHRYYRTIESSTYFCDGCGRERCCSQYCRGGLTYEYSYKSKYIGKDINKALLELLF